MLLFIVTEIACWVSQHAIFVCTALWGVSMIIRKRKNITEESISRVRQKTRVCESYKDPDGHPCVGYMDGDEFVPN